MAEDMKKEMVHDDMKEHHKEEKEMTFEKLKKIFKEDFCDEIKDSNKYMDMAMFAEQMGNEKLAKGLMEMSHDEYTHAKFIHYNLVNWGCEIPSDSLMKWHDLKERIEHMFR